MGQRHVTQYNWDDMPKELGAAPSAQSASSIRHPAGAESSMNLPDEPLASGRYCPTGFRRADLRRSRCLRQ